MFNASKTPSCELCGDPMPAGEEMFKYHGYSGPCPKPPKVATDEFRPDWKLTPAEKLSVALNLSLAKHIPNWPGCTDEQLEAVANDVLAILKTDGGSYGK